MLRIHFELALGAVAGASASMLVDNIRVVAGELADDMPMGGEMAGDMNRFANGDFEMTEAGADPPFNPPTGWSPSARLKTRLPRLATTITRHKPTAMPFSQLKTHTRAMK